MYLYLGKGVILRFDEKKESEKIIKCPKSRE